MVKIISDNAEVSFILNEICDLIKGQGGSIHPDIIIKCQNNDISVESSICYGSDKPKDFAFKIPHELLVVYDNFVFEIDADQKIQIHSHVEDIAPNQLKLTKLMLALYNATNKLQTHIQGCVWHAFKESPETIGLLIKGRQGLDLNLISKFVREDDKENLALLTFFKTRLLDCQLHKRVGDTESIMMPLADSMNHHLRGGAYQNFYTPEGAFLTVPLVQPIEGSHACFVQYGVFDSLDTYMHYGFMDESIPFLRSIPVTIDLGEWGSMEIKALNSYVEPHNVPDGFKDLGFYMPIINADHDKRHVALSHIIIPGASAPKALRRIVSLAIRLLHPEMDRATIQRWMLEVEATLWKANMGYYEAMQKNAEGLSDSNAQSAIIKGLSAQQLSVLNTYKALLS